MVPKKTERGKRGEGILLTRSKRARVKRFQRKRAKGGDSRLHWARGRNEGILWLKPFILFSRMGLFTWGGGGG